MMLEYGEVKKSFDSSIGVDLADHLMKEIDRDS